MNERQFSQAFSALTDNPQGHFPWQWAWYQYLADGEFDRIATTTLPTGLGKTLVMGVWLIALANDQKGVVPRRLVYVVNRRTVVDQSTDVAEELRNNLNEKPELAELKKKLGTLGISTLRGQFADNREWSADPSQPAIIVGTVDMIGSRLLFSGYGVGFKAKPLHAGFLGQDVVLVHDEAHLEPAFQELLIAIEREQKRCNELAAFRVVELSATSRGEKAFELTDADYEHHEVRKRIHAAKNLNLHPIEDEKKETAEKLVNLARAHKDSGKAILVFARNVETVNAVTVALLKDKQLIGRVKQLTGTLRGLERDELVDETVFKRFLPNSSGGEETVYLICTSAGEVGVNISADHLVCDLSLFDSMAQRFGRVNRFGLATDTRIDIVHPSSLGKDGKMDPVSRARMRTLELLRSLKGDGSPAALAELSLEDRREAFSPQPTILASSSILFDAWAFTTIRDKLPGRPPVAPYLHGVSDYEPPETHVAWREEVWELNQVFANDLERKQFQRFAEGLLEDYPLKLHELLRDRTDRILSLLKKLKAPPETPVWLQSDEGKIEAATLGEIVERDKEALADMTVILPPQAGGLEPTGFLTGAEYDPAFEKYDVADQWQDKRGLLRKRQWHDENRPLGMKLERTIPFANSDDEDAEVTRVWYWFVRLPEAPSAKSLRTYDLEPHLNDAAAFAQGIVELLPLPADIKRAVVIAARFHDLGKRRKVWQQGIGNSQYPQQVWAKSGRRVAAGKEHSLYRHEFGSLLDIRDESDFQSLSPELQDLALHLIAAHHGRGRPHFSVDEAFDLERGDGECASLVEEVARRYARLQRKFGRWGLAYLESLVRAADILASRRAEGENV